MFFFCCCFLFVFLFYSQFLIDTAVHFLRWLKCFRWYCCEQIHRATFSQPLGNLPPFLNAKKKREFRRDTLLCSVCLFYNDKLCIISIYWSVGFNFSLKKNYPRFARRSWLKCKYDRGGRLNMDSMDVVFYSRRIVIASMIKNYEYTCPHQTTYTNIYACMCAFIQQTTYQKHLNQEKTSNKERKKESVVNANTYRISK